MPLVKIFAKHTLQKPIPLVALQSKLCSIWGTKPDTTKLMLQRVDDWTDESFAEDVYGTYKGNTTRQHLYSDTDVIAIASGWLQLTFVPRERRKEHESMYWMV